MLLGCDPAVGPHHLHPADLAALRRVRRPHRLLLRAPALRGGSVQVLHTAFFSELRPWEEDPYRYTPPSSQSSGPGRRVNRYTPPSSPSSGPGRRIRTGNGTHYTAATV